MITICEAMVCSTVLQAISNFDLFNRKVNKNDEKRIVLVGRSLHSEKKQKPKNIMKIWLIKQRSKPILFAL
jgi:hypothetical protein